MLKHEILKLALKIDKYDHKLADRLDRIADALDDDFQNYATCGTCSGIIGPTTTCKSCGWNEQNICKQCTMKKTGGFCPDCGDSLGGDETMAKALT